eukprot:309613_1
MNGDTDMKDQSWSTKEKHTFEHGLQLYGRNWKKIEKMTDINKSRKQIVQFAEKHFQYLYQNGLPLPNKVKETGVSYSTNTKTKSTNTKTNKHMSTSTSGIAYSLPHIKEGFRSTDEALSHLPALWIRPSNLKTFNSCDLEVILGTIWFMKYNKL